MTDRIDTERQFLVEEIKNIEREIDSIKNAQFIGTDSIQLYRNLTGQQFDIQTADTWVAPQTSKIHNYAVVFEADTQVAPVNKLSLYTEINGVVVNVSEFMKLNDPPVFFNSILHDYFLIYAERIPEPGLDGWYFATTSYVSGTSIKIRFTVDSTDTGTITWYEI